MSLSQNVCGLFYFLWVVFFFFFFFFSTGWCSCVVMLSDVKCVFFIRSSSHALDSHKTLTSKVLQQYSETTVL